MNKEFQLYAKLKVLRYMEEEGPFFNRMTGTEVIGQTFNPRQLQEFSQAWDDETNRLREEVLGLGEELGIDIATICF